MNTHITALHFITGCLACKNPTQTNRLRAHIKTQTLSWEAVAELANNHLLTPALWIALKNNDLTDNLPEDFRAYLIELHKLSIERNNKLRTQLLEAVKQLNDRGITPVLLKGAMHLVSHIYDDPGIRMMSDLDILVGADQVEEAFTALLELGYQQEADHQDDYPEDHHHCPPLFRPGDYASLEVHRELFDKPFKTMLCADSAIQASDPLVFEGHSMRVLNPSHRALHNILHSQIIDNHHAEGTLPLRSLYEVISESNASNRIDWIQLKQTMQQHNRHKALDAYLHLAHRLFNTSLAPNSQATLASRLYYQRCLMQLAWEWANDLGIRLGGFSADHIREIYECGDDWLALNKARIKHSLRRFSHKER